MIKDILTEDLTLPELYELKQVEIGERLASILNDDNPSTIYSTMVNYYELDETVCPLCNKPLTSGSAGSRMCMYCKTTLIPVTDKETVIMSYNKEGMVSFLESLTGKDYSEPEEDTQEEDTELDDDEDTVDYYNQASPHDKRDSFEDLEAIVNDFSTEEYQTFDFYEQAVNAGFAELGCIVKTLAKELAELREQVKSYQAQSIQSKASPSKSPIEEIRELLKALELHNYTLFKRTYASIEEIRELLKALEQRDES